MKKTALLTYVGGQFLPAEKASVPITSAGLLQGLGVYETLRTYAGRPFRLKAHLHRMRQGTAFLGFRLKETDAQIAAAVDRLIETNRVADARIRITATVECIELIETVRTTPATLIITATILEPYPPRLYQQGAPVVIATARVKELDPLTLHKTTCRIRYFLALRAAHRAKAVEAIFLNTLGHVAEGAISNIFIVYRGRLLPPPIEEGLMPGIPRQVVLEMAHADRLLAEERPITLDVLLRAEEVMITNSIMEVMPVSSVDGKPIGSGRPGPITQRLAEEYKDVVRRETHAR
jgi:branched-subunit amino acid aminotransferase/4-amino-4-deoxychorismate lyase